MRQNILIFAGILGFLAGVAFLLQGAGILRVPTDSMMIGDSDWIARGAILAVVSAIVVAGARLAPTKQDRRAARRKDRASGEAE